MDQYFLGIDSGTQSTKAVVLSRETRAVVAQASAPHQLIENECGRREQEPSWWATALESVLDSLFKNSRVQPKQICAIGVSGQQHGFVPVDKRSEVLRPAKLWCDTETTDQARRLTEKLGGEHSVIGHTGNAIAVGFTASKIVWLQENEPKNFEKIHKILLPHDYLNFWLTGEIKTECGDASGTGYFDVRTRSWSQKVLQAIDPSGRLQSCLPELIQSHEPVGTLRSELCQRWGFQDKVLVSSGGGDNMMAAIGTGNVLPGVVTVSLGTSGTLFAFSEKPIVDTQGELASFCSSCGHWLPLICTMNVTNVTESVRRLFGASLEEFNIEAALAAPGSEGLMLLPYLNGERTPALPEGRGNLWGLNGQNLKQSNVFRAAMEGASFGLRYGLDVFRRLNLNPQEIRVVGGGAQSVLWRHILANLFSCSIVAPKVTEGAALGAALQAFWCYQQQSEAKGAKLSELTSHYVQLNEETRTHPSASEQQAYESFYQQYRRLHQTLYPHQKERR